MAHKKMMWKLKTAIQTGNEWIVAQLIDENCSDYKLIRMALEEGQEKISRFILKISYRIHSMEEALLKSLIELALEREYISFIVLLVDKSIPHKARNIMVNNSLFYCISNIKDKKMMDSILNKLKNLSGINESDTVNFELLELFIGIIRNDYRSFERFKKMDIDINKSIVAKSSILNGYTALHVAVLCENRNFTKILLNFGSKTSVRDAGDLTPIHHGLKIKNNTVNKTLLCAFMLEYDPVDYHGISPLHIACMLGSMSKAKQYLQNFSDVNQQIMHHNSEYHGCTPLHLVVNEGFVPLVKLLLNYGADVSVMNAKRMSPLHLALFLRKDKIVYLLLTTHVGNLNNPVDYRGIFHFHIACSRGNIAVAEMFLQNRVALDKQVFATSTIWPLYSALHLAVLSSCTPIIKHLLSKGANPNCQDSNGFTPLNLACFKGLAKSAEALLEFKVDLNIRSKGDLTPLQSAITRGHYKIVKRLVEEGVDINSRDNRTATSPLILAVLYKRSKIVKYLLNNGANAAAKRCDGSTALHVLALLRNSQERPRGYFISQERLSAFSILFDHESYQDDIDFVLLDDYFYYCMVEKLVAQGCNINARDDRQFTPLHYACLYKRIALVVVLLQHGADIDATDTRNHLALQYVIESHEPIAAIFYKHIMKLKYIGCSLNSFNESYHEANKKRFRSSDYLLQTLFDRELDQMKNETIDNYFSMYHFLITDPDDLLTYTNNSILMEYIFHHDFKNERYPEFGALIQANFRIAKKRARLFMFAKTSLQLLTKVPLPDRCSFNIFRYLNEEDLKHLILSL